MEKCQVHNTGSRAVQCCVHYCLLFPKRGNEANRILQSSSISHTVQYSTCPLVFVYCLVMSQFQMAHMAWYTCFCIIILYCTLHLAFLHVQKVQLLYSLFTQHDYQKVPRMSRFFLSLPLFCSLVLRKCDAKGVGSFYRNYCNFF